VIKNNQYQHNMSSLFTVSPAITRATTTIHQQNHELYVALSLRRFIIFTNSKNTLDCYFVDTTQSSAFIHSDLVDKSTSLHFCSCPVHEQS